MPRRKTKRFGIREKTYMSITMKDKEMVDKGWHRFWAKRGGTPSLDYDLQFGKGMQDKEKQRILDNVLTE